jgi:hypothetical protein
MNNIVSTDFRIPEYSNILLFGITSGGKSGILLNFLQNQEKVFQGQRFSKIEWAYGIEQPELFKLLKKRFGTSITFYDGINPMIKFIDEHNVDYFQLHNTLFIAEDLDFELFTSLDIKNIFTRVSHHKKFSILGTVQSPDIESKYRIAILRNTHVYIIMTNPLMFAPLRTINKNVLPHLPYMLLQLNKLLIKKAPFSYFILNLSPKHIHQYCLYNNLLGNSINVFIREENY